MSRAPQPSKTIQVAIVAPSLSILGGQAVQADRLLAAWRGDPDVTAWLVPVNPTPSGRLRHALGVKYARTIATQLAYWPRLWRELRRADVVHVFSASYFSFILSPLPAVLVGKALGRPVLLNYRSGQAPDHLRRSAVARAALRRVDRNVVPSRFLVEVLAGYGIKSEVVPNLVDLDAFSFRSRDRLEPKLLSTRNLYPLYNLACTLRAFRIVQDARPTATLTLVGSGSEEGALKELAGALGLRGVAFVGRIEPSAIPRFYREADIYVQTPNIDNMPASVLEGFASGTPVVSTDAGGIPAILTDGVHGLLAGINDHEGIAHQILRLLDDPALAQRLAISARQQCEAYTWGAVRQQWLAQYLQLLPSTSPAPMRLDAP